ncbi:hypothetical protein EV421DRAFT_1964822 [Armillaria borealis]|uniref:Uncharacterized protein n=1 Tax=Armillaria borealis TaxID=47425 RepID=A0AA39MN64_9AGAR|nr:hypothetical protein EV421DRAFT_1964822 [Armillaria borealis]
MSQLFHDQRSVEPSAASNDETETGLHSSTSPNQILQRAKTVEEKNFEREIQEMRAQMQGFISYMQGVMHRSYIAAVKASIAASKASRAASEAAKASPEATRERTLLYQTVNRFCRGLIDTLRGTGGIDAIVEEISTAISDVTVANRLLYLPYVLIALEYYNARNSGPQSLPLLAQYLPLVVHDGHTRAAEALEEISSRYSLLPLTLWVHSHQNDVTILVTMWVIRLILDHACYGITIHAIPSVEFARTTLQYFAREWGLDVQLQLRIDEIVMTLIDVRNRDGRLKYFDSEVEV